MPRFQFLPIGQWLFYAGQIGDWNFVYDCWTDSSKNILYNAILDYRNFNQKNSIDLFVLSHLHEDHFNGIPELLKRYRIKRFVLPFFVENIRLLFWIGFVLNKWPRMSNREILSDPYARFISDPAEYLRNNEIENIDFIDEMGERRAENVSRTVAWSLPFEWCFDFYQKKFRIPSSVTDWLISALRDELGIPIVLDDNGKYSVTDVLERILERMNMDNSGDFLDSLRDIYEHFFPGKLNETSIVMIHYPPKGHDYSCCRISSGFGLNCAKTFVQVLTWDFPLKTAYIEFQWFVKDPPNCPHCCYNKRDVGIFQISHHGSKKDWVADILHDFPNSYPVISCWIVNRHHHPWNEVLFDILVNKWMAWWWSNESSGVEIRFL